MLYGVVLLLDDASTEKAIWLSQRYWSAAEDNAFVLGKDTNIPHLSMLHLELDGRGVGNIRFWLEGVTALAADALPEEVPAPSGRFDRVLLRDQWLFWMTPKSEPLVALHETCVEVLSGYRCRDVDITWSMNEAQRRMHRRYGYPAVMECFEPHVTLGFLRKDSIDEVEEIAPFEWTAEWLALAEIGDRGRVVRIVAKYPL